MTTEIIKKDLEDEDSNIVIGKPIPSITEVEMERLKRPRKYKGTIHDENGKEVHLLTDEEKERRMKENDIYG